MKLEDAAFRSVSFPSAEMRVERRQDGTLIVEPTTELAAFVPNLPKVLAQQAQDRPDQSYLLERGGINGDWIAATYADVNRDAAAVAQWILNRNIERDRSILILSGNSIQHAVFKYGAMAAHLPVCPVSVNYSLMGGDYGRLKHVISMLRPAIVFAEDTQRFGKALDTVDFADAVVITGNPQQLQREAVSVADVLSTEPGAGVDQSIDSIDPDAPATYMLTSGSTSLPKAVIQTNRMITANLAQGKQVLGDAAGWDDVILDWLPWNHVSGAFTKMGALVSGGTLYIDAGRPIPGEFETTVRNLKEIPVKYFPNVPAGYAMLADALESDAELRRVFFSKLRLALYGGAGLSQALYDRLQQLAVDTIGEKVFFTTGYGATETTSGCMAIYFHTEEVGIGLPMPGLKIKMVPIDDRYELRMKGQMVASGYVGDTATQLFDSEGYLKIGDCAEFCTPGNISHGLKFAGRLAEEFKLANGTWVSGSALRAAIVQALSPVVSDAVICGMNSEYVAALLWLNRDAATRFFGHAVADSAAGIAGHPDVRKLILERLGEHNNAKPGSSTRIRRVMFLLDPPSIDGHELSDKGTVNQSVALRRRAKSVELLYSAEPDAAVIVLD